MINRLRKILTGYASVTKKVNGKEYRFMYSGKPIFFDPSQMISELKRNESELISRNLASSENFESLLGRLPVRSEKEIPTVICQFKSGDKEITVSRYTLKREKYPVSQYVFEENQVLLGIFCRIYDYGALAASYIEKLELDFVEKNTEITSWKWKTSSESWFLVEKFGHTQLWCWNGPLEKFS